MQTDEGCKTKNIIKEHIFFIILKELGHNKCSKIKLNVETGHRLIFKQKYTLFLNSFWL
jgi:hypothetical protein